MAKKMDAFSASLMADKREIVFAPTVYKFETFAQMAEEFKLNERDVVLTNEFIYTPFMKELDLKCQFVFQEKFGAGEPSAEMIQNRIVAYIFRRSFILINAFNIFSNLLQFILLTKKGKGNRSLG